MYAGHNFSKVYPAHIHIFAGMNSDTKTRTYTDRQLSRWAERQLNSSTYTYYLRS